MVEGMYDVYDGSGYFLGLGLVVSGLYYSISTIFKDLRSCRAVGLMT